MPRNLSYKADLLEDLKDPEYAAAYLSAAIADSREAFLVALRDVAEAEKGMAAVAQEADVNRENLYRSLSKKGNPRYSTFMSVMEALGFSLRVETPHKTATDPLGPSATGIAKASTSNSGTISDSSSLLGTSSATFPNMAAMMTGDEGNDLAEQEDGQVPWCLVAAQASETQEALQV